jgi:hypothetical protein
LNVLNNSYLRRFQGIIDCLFNDLVTIDDTLAALGKYFRKPNNIFKEKNTYLALLLVDYRSRKESYSIGPWSFFP